MEKKIVRLSLRVSLQYQRNRESFKHFKCQSEIMELKKIETTAKCKC